MTHGAWLSVALLVSAAGVAHQKGDSLATRVAEAGPTSAEAGPASRQRPPRVELVTLAVRHRVFDGFKDTQRVRLNQEFRVGDTDYTAKVTRFEPDFAMALEGRRVFSRSAEPRNPAFRILVKKQGSPQDTVWAFLKAPPHFARKSMLAFRILRIDFAGRPPLSNPDTTAAGGDER